MADMYTNLNACRTYTYRWGKITRDSMLSLLLLPIHISGPGYLTSRAVWPGPVTAAASATRTAPG